MIRSWCLVTNLEIANTIQSGYDYPKCSWKIVYNLLDENKYQSWYGGFTFNGVAPGGAIGYATMPNAKYCFDQR